MPFVSINDPAKPCNKLDPMYFEAKRAIDITKKFIADRGLICYGGTALDYAARLQGSRIYDDTELDLPDLDFYSLDPYKDGCDLADILFQNGFTRSRCINAIHIGTFRVDCGSNHFVADVGYCPVLSELKTLKYEGILIVDPIYQRIDAHRAISHPYDGPPQEAIFNRLKKDIERFNIIHELYPVAAYKRIGGQDPARLKITLDPRVVYSGQVAFQRFIEEDVNVSVIELCSLDPEDTIEALGLELVAGFEPYFNMLPECYFCRNHDGIKYIIYSTEDTLVSYESLEIDGVKYRFSCANYVLRLFLGWLLVADVARIKWPWLPDYINNATEAYNRLLSSTRLSIKVYGTKNINHTTLVKMEEQDAKISGMDYVTKYPLPKTYAPYQEKIDIDKSFNYRSNILLRISGNGIE